MRLKMCSLSVKKNGTRAFLLAIFGLLGYSTLSSDAIVITRAMLASTIAEVFIRDDSVVVELEIGAADLEAFRNLLPDPLFERMGHDPEPWADRLVRFVEQDFVIRDGTGQTLFGFLREIEPRSRTFRDEVTGEPLPADPDSAETVVFARITYPTGGRPERLTLSAPGGQPGSPAASVGFVTYHSGLPINDFRYLGQSETLELDWNDPWYSSFENRNLRRQYFAPISAFLYVEPYEVRKEIVFRPKDLQQWVDLGLTGKDTIRAEDYPEIISRAVEFLRQRNPVTIDGQPAEGYMDRAHFIYRNLRTSGVIDPPIDLSVVSAEMGVIFTYQVDGLPDQVVLEWELFGDRIPMVPSAATDEAGPLPYILSPGDNVLTWNNYLQNPTLPVLVEVAAPPRFRWLFRVVAVAAVVLLGVLLYRNWQSLMSRTLPPRPVMLGGLVALVLALLTIPRAIGLGVSDGEAEQVVSDLLRNVYRSFDYRQEGQIYDMLERSVSGELLTDIYLETRRSLELENQGGARAKVKEVTIINGEYASADGGGFVSHLTWNVLGSVGHWGHIHQRMNQYEARFVIQVVGGEWRIVELELIQEQRL
jgi:hypothetical protein